MSGMGTGRGVSLMRSYLRGLFTTFRLWLTLGGGTRLALWVFNQNESLYMADALC